MRLTSFTDFGPRMAGASDTAVATAGPADASSQSRIHLTKIMRQRARGDIIDTWRGGGGGVWLRQDPAAIRLDDLKRPTLADIVPPVWTAA